MKDLFKSVIRCFLQKHPQLSTKISRFLGGRYLVNINLNLLNLQQKKVLFSYVYLDVVDLEKITHSNYLHANQMLQYFIEKGYCVDVCTCYDLLSFEILKDKKYDVIIGLGEVFKRVCKNNPNAQKIIFVTENNPTVVAKKYAERIEYFRKRHPNVNYNSSVIRDGYLDEEMFMLADSAIIMNSLYNAESMKYYFNNVFLIKSNAFFNKEYLFDRQVMDNNIEEKKYDFLWFGSDGFIHKGVDILIDAFREMPEFSISFYGLSVAEKSLFHKLKTKNTMDCGRVNVQKVEFIHEIVNRHCFIIFPSCSEGMSTAVATCMAHGIIPIITKECGFEPCEYIIELEGWHVEDIKKTVKQVVSMNNDEIFNFSLGCYKYARTNFSLECFDNSFRNIMELISKKNL